MGILKQTEPKFKTIQEVEEFINQREVSIQFWRTIKSVDMSELIVELERIIRNAKLTLMEMKLCDVNLQEINGD